MFVEPLPQKGQKPLKTVPKSPSEASASEPVGTKTSTVQPGKIAEPLTSQPCKAKAHQTLEHAAWVHSVPSMPVASLVGTWWNPCYMWPWQQCQRWQQCHLLEFSQQCFQLNSDFVHDLLSGPPAQFYLPPDPHVLAVAHFRVFGNVATLAPRPYSSEGLQNSFAENPQTFSHMEVPTLPPVQVPELEPVLVPKPDSVAQGPTPAIKAWKRKAHFKPRQLLLDRLLELKLLEELCGRLAPDTDTDLEYLGESTESQNVWLAESLTQSSDNAEQASRDFEAAVARAESATYLIITQI